MSIAEKLAIIAENQQKVYDAGVAVIPDGYHDVTEVDATASDVLKGKKIVASDGTVVEGELVEKADPVLQDSILVTPGSKPQHIKPDDGYDGLSEVVVGGSVHLIPENIVAGVNIFGVIGTAIVEGDLPTGVSAINTGTYTCTTAPSTQVVIKHGLGKDVDFFIVYAEGGPHLNTDFNYYTIAQFGLKIGIQIGSAAASIPGFRVLRYGTSSNIVQMANNGAIGNTSVFAIYNSSTYQLKPGITYRWIAGAF